MHPSFVLLILYALLLLCCISVLLSVFVASSHIIFISFVDPSLIHLLFIPFSISVHSVTRMSIREVNEGGSKKQKRKGIPTEIIRELIEQELHGKVVLNDDDMMAYVHASFPLQQKSQWCV